MTDDAPQGLGTVGRYRLEAEIGRGGMGIVYRASDPELDRPVAIKLVQGVPFVRYDKLRARLLREAKVLAKLTHPNVVRVYDCGQHEGEVYLAMEYVEGATLRDWQGGRSRRSIVEAYQEAARGLAAAHDMGIVHRDFKPDNVLVASDGHVLVGDFGLAGVLVEDEPGADGSRTDAPTTERISATRTGALLGTLAYMAPEQLRGEVATSRSDQFAFCVSLWEALTGVRPFEGQQGEVLLGHIEQGRIRGAERLPRRLRARLLRGLATDPEARFADVRELAEGLLPRRRRAVLGAAGSSLVVGLAVGLLLQGPSVGLPKPELCPPQSSLAYVDGMQPQWRRARERLDDAGLHSTYERLERLRESMRAELRGVCPPGPSASAAHRQQLDMRIRRLGSVLSVLGSSEELQLASVEEAIDEIGSERRSAPPPKELDKGVVKRLLISYDLRLNGHLEEALDVVENAKALAGGRELELALVERWRGDVLAFMGNRHEEAIAAYGEAVGHADAVSYDDARLESELLVAKIAVMRLGDLERARDSLMRARGLLLRLREPWLSPRRADYDEVLAAVLKREGDLDAALEHQRYALLVRGWSGDQIELGRGYLNLGTIYEWRNRSSDSALAGVCYRQAVETLDPLAPSPEWLQAVFNLGHWLAQNGDANEWPYAKELLQKAREGSEEIRPSALTDLVILAVQEGDAKTARALALQLDALVRDSSLSAERRLDAWQSVALAHAMLEDLSAFEDARSCFERVAREVLEDAPTRVDGMEQQTAELDLSAAQMLAERAPERARELATSVRDYLLRLPEAKRQPLLEMLLAAEKLISSTPE